MNEAELKKTLCCGPPALVTVTLMANPREQPKMPAHQTEAMGLCQGSWCAAFRGDGDKAWCGLAGRPE